MATYEDKQSRPAIADWRHCSSCNGVLVEREDRGEKVLVCPVCMRVTTKNGQKKRLRELNFHLRQGEGEE